MSTIIFESSPYYLVLCAMASATLAWILYNAKNPWSTRVNKILLGIRATLLFLLFVLLLSPILRQVKNKTEKPVMVLLEDNSASVKQVVDSQQQQVIKTQQQELIRELEEQDYTVEQRNLDNGSGLSDFTKIFREVTADFEGKKVTGVVFVSDGIYNAGLSPLYNTYNFPIHTIGVGDTTQRTDVIVKNVAFNKVAYQGNRFPIRVEISAIGFKGKSLEIQLLHKGRSIEKKIASIENESLTSIEFQVPADEKGIQRYEVVATPQPQEWNRANNRSTLFVEVVDGKKKILALASAPHPDIKAIRAVVEQNSNYEFVLFTPSVSKEDFNALLAEADLVVAFQSPDVKGASRIFFQRVIDSKKSLFLLCGIQSDWRELARLELVKMEAPHRQYDEVVPALNAVFTNFIIDENVASVFNTYPPASVPFAKFQWSVSSTSLLFQKVGSLVTDKPLLAVDVEGERKMAILLGEGIWRWRMHEYSRNENTEAFDEVFGKLIQYLVTADDRKRFRCFPVQQQFSDAESVVLETQVYNEIFEPVYGQVIDIELTNEAGEKTDYRYTTSAVNTRYTLGSLTEGVYRYKASTTIKNKPEEVRGEFLVRRQEIELQNLTADFDLLRKLSRQTGGSFYKANEFVDLQKDLTKQQAVASIYSEENFDPLINLKWVFLLLLIIVSAEWFMRKYSGGY